MTFYQKSEIFAASRLTSFGEGPYKQPVPHIRSADEKGKAKKGVIAQHKVLEYLVRLTIHPDDHLPVSQRRPSATARTNGGRQGQTSAF